MSKQKINCFANITFIFPVTENEVEYVTQTLRANCHQVLVKFQKM